tara:strand:+ start:691 stop:1059 length:369 start_codon:yes stop_codon:yes gene_type:complete
MSDLLALAARVEALEGPCRETDAVIRYWTHAKLQAAGSLAGWLATDASRSATVPAFTASMDAAATLLPADTWAEATIDWPSCIEVHCGHVLPALGRSGAATPALALTAASLRARAGMEKQDG